MSTGPKSPDRDCKKVREVYTQKQCLSPWKQQIGISNPQGGEGNLIWEQARFTINEYIQRKLTQDVMKDGIAVDTLVSQIVHFQIFSWGRKLDD